jgi:glycosyltransferase involved in cell wall biosynthesis
MPSLSIILPVYNGGKLLQESVESVLSQSFKDFEFLIVDDCSTDASWDYLISLKDSRVRLFKNEINKGLFFNLNFLINKSSAALIKLWSQDDKMVESALEEILEFHQKYPGLGFSYTALKFIDENGDFIKKPLKIDNTPPIVNTELHSKVCFYTGSIAGNIANVTLTREALTKVGLFNEKMVMSGDFEMWVRIAQYFNIGFLNKPLILLREHSGQLSKQEKYGIKVMQEDIATFHYLFNYLPEDLRKYGRNHLRNYKLVYYYTLMLKTLIQGNFIKAVKYWKGINKIDNSFIVTYYFIKNRFIMPLIGKKLMHEFDTE